MEVLPPLFPFSGVVCTEELPPPLFFFIPYPHFWIFYTKILNSDWSPFAPPILISSFLAFSDSSSPGGLTVRLSLVYFRFEIAPVAGCVRKTVFYLVGRTFFVARAGCAAGFKVWWVGVFFLPPVFGVS